MRAVMRSFETERVFSRPLKIEDREGVSRLWAEPRVCEFSGVVTDREGDTIVTPFSSTHDAVRLVEFWLDAAERGWGGRWAMLSKTSGDFLGMLGYNSIAPVVELAYHLHPEHWGEGLMSEALTGFIALVRQEHARPLLAVIDSRNTPSIRLITRLGFSLSHVADDGLVHYVCT